MNCKEIMKIDSHCDTITYVIENNLSLMNNNKSQISVEKLLSSNTKIQYMAVYIDSHLKYPDCYDKAISCIYELKKYERENSSIKIIENQSDLEYVLETDNLVGFVIAVEGGHTIGNDLENIKTFKSLGVKAITVLYNNNNFLGTGALEEKDKGLFDLGERAIKLIEEQNIIVDVSHCSIKTFYDILSIANRPVMASHSVSDSIHSNKRNLTNHQIKILSSNKGIIGVNYHNDFVGNKRDIQSLVDHIENIVNIGGEFCIGLGSDFDGCNLISGLEDVTKVYKIGDAMIKRNYSMEIIERLFYKNQLEFLKKFL